MRLNLSILTAKPSTLANMVAFTLYSSLLFSAIGLVQSLSSEQWRSQSIYQVVTDRFARTDGSTTASCGIDQYCGGTWQGIVDHLDYIQNMGFTAIWISPVVENIKASGSDGTSYHGYWAKNIYEVNTNFGSASDLVALSDALHARGMVRHLPTDPKSQQLTCDSTSWSTW
jgi:alpha-amylase